MRRTLPLAALCLLILAATSPAQGVPSPEEFFGFRMGESGELVDYFRSLEYYKLLAERSDRILYSELGRTTDGNPFVLLIISSPDNLARLEEIKAERERLSDPRKVSPAEARELAARLPAVAYHTGNIHTTEISCAHVPVELVYDLVSGDSAETESVLKNVITLVVPNANPDGLVVIKKWFEEHKGSPWEGRMPWLYHSYVGHDNNRDWILLHFNEQRLVATRVYNEWHPIYSVEMHQMGNNGPRIFVPPYQDPVDPNAAPQTVEVMSLVGLAMSHRLTAEGKAGVVKGAIFDLFTPARAYNMTHGTGRILTETAGADFVRDIVQKPEDIGTRGRGMDFFSPNEPSVNYPMPWRGGTWAFRDLVEYQLITNKAALALAASHSAELNYSQYMARKFACDGIGWPYAYVFPAEQRDPGSAALLLQALQRGRVEVQRARAPFAAGGARYGSGSLVVVLRQPFAAWAKTLLEIQDYPDLRRSPSDPPPTPYDSTAHTLPLLMGVRADRIDETFAADLEPVGERVFFEGRIIGDGPAGYMILPEANDAFAAADDLLDGGHTVKRLLTALAHEEYSFPAGCFYAEFKAGLADKLKALAKERYFVARGLRERLPESAALAPLRNPRIGIYEPWGGNIASGWTRLVMEQWGLEAATVRNGDIGAGALNDKFDIIIFPHGVRAESLVQDIRYLPEEYRKGIGAEGLGALRDFMSNGGTLLAFGSSSMELARLLGLPVENKLEGLRPQDHFAPGTILLVELREGCKLAYGLPNKLPVKLMWGPAFVPVATTEPGPVIAARYPDYNPRLSGYLIGPEHLQGAGAMVVQPVGKGRAILMAFRPQFRAMTHGSYKLLFNAVFLAAMEQH